MSAHPFAAGSYTLGDGRVVHTQHTAVLDRIRAVSDFTAEQCAAALALPDLQKTVRAAIERRQRVLARSQE